MPLIADICPNCRRVTRCQVFERSTRDLSLRVMGVPVASMPVASIFVVCCGECGGEFKSRTWDERRALSPDEAMALETEQILALTNPALRAELVLGQLRSEPRLGDAFTLLGELKPCGLHKELQAALVHWPRLSEGQRDQFLTNVRRCDAAIGFAHTMATQSKPVATGLVVGIPVGVVVGLGCHWALDSRQGFWSGVAGFVAGAAILSWIWSIRDQRWISDVLIPEADQERIHFGWFLHVLHEGGLRTQLELKDLCDLAWPIHSKLVADGRVLEEPVFIPAATAKPA